jgi:DNA gyrase subunit B
MDADIYRDATHYHLEFKKGENVGGLQKEDVHRPPHGKHRQMEAGQTRCLRTSNVPGSYYFAIR